MKTKKYITPDILITELEGKQMICAGSTKFKGVVDEGIGESPKEGDSFRGRRGRSDWDDEDEEDDW